MIRRGIRTVSSQLRPLRFNTIPYRYQYPMFFSSIHHGNLASQQFERKWINQCYGTEAEANQVEKSDSSSEVDVQKENFFTHFQSVRQLMQKFDEVVESMKDTGIGETLTETPMQDKENIMQNVVNHLKEMVESIEKITFIESAKVLTGTGLGEPLVVESYEEEAVDLRGTEEFVEDKSGEFMEEFLEDEEEVDLDASFAPVHSKLFQEFIRVLQALGKLERNEIASSLTTKVYNLCLRVVNELESAPQQLLKQEFFADNVMVKLNTQLYNQMLLTYALKGDRENTVIILQDMKEREVKANSHTYHALVQLAISEGDYTQASKVIDYATRSGFQLLPETLALLEGEEALNEN
jgi:hypothetical protein